MDRLRARLLHELELRPGQPLSVREFLALVHMEESEHNSGVINRSLSSETLNTKVRRERSRKRQQVHRKVLYHLHALIREGVVASKLDAISGVLRFYRSGAQSVLLRTGKKTPVWSIGWFDTLQHCEMAILSVLPYLNDPCHIADGERLSQDIGQAKMFLAHVAATPLENPLLVIHVRLGKIPFFVSIEPLLVFGSEKIRFVLYVPPERLMTHHEVISAVGQSPSRSFISIYLGDELSLDVPHRIKQGEVLAKIPLPGP